MATHNIYAVVKESEKNLFVTTLNDTEIDEQGEFGIEMLVMDWCIKKNLTFIDYTI